MNAAGSAAGIEKPAMKRSAVKIWVKTVRSITARQRTRQRPDTGISALLHDQTGIPDTCQGKNLSGQYARSVLREFEEIVQVKFYFTF